VLLFGFKLDLIVVNVCKSDQNVQIFSHLPHLLRLLLNQDGLVSKQLPLSLQQLKLLRQTDRELFKRVVAILVDQELELFRFSGPVELRFIRRLHLLEGKALCDELGRKKLG